MSLRWQLLLVWTAWAVAMAGLLAFVWPSQVAAAPPRPVVVTIHGGGYYLGDPEMAQATADFRALGYKVVPDPYTLGDVNQGWLDTKAVVAAIEPGRAVYAYGESAGGGYAAKLASKGLVDAAYGHSPLVDVTDPAWADVMATRNNCNAACRDKFTMTGDTPLSPYRAQVPLQDQYVDPSDMLGWAEREAKVTAVGYPGLHMFPLGADYDADIATAAAYFDGHPPVAARGKRSR